MSLIELTETILKSLVKDKNSISVKQLEEDNELIIQIVLKEEDKSVLFDKDGKILNSLKTILQASSYLKENKRVKIDITSY